MPTEENNINTNQSEVLAQQSVPVQSDVPQSQNSTPTYTYAGFWWRFLAYLIDGLVLLPVMLVVYFFIAMLLIGLGFADKSTSLSHSGSISLSSPLAVFINFFLILFIYIVIPLAVYAYFAYCESSAWQGTPGKKALGMIVTDDNGNKLTFGRAFGRNVSKILSGLTCCIGYILAGFTDKKQALHDLIAKTLVLKSV